MKITTLSLVACCLFAIGCGSSSTTTTTKTAPAQDLEKVYGPINVVEDTVMAVATAGGLTYAPAPKGKTTPRTESLQNVGDEIVMKYGESLFIVLDSLNPAAVTIESRIDEATKTETLRVVDREGRCAPHAQMPGGRSCWGWCYVVPKDRGSRRSLP
ncbi:MAG: hypothetical protein IPH49_11130 [Ignavibacteria bacterium]|nr:hypothetical protein [Ignavibacteria bacterium]